MLPACLFLTPATFHVQCLSCKRLQIRHGLLVEFPRFASSMIHPVEKDVGMTVGFPFGLASVIHRVIMSFIPVYENLNSAYSPPLLTLLCEADKVIHRSIGFDKQDSLTDGTAACDFLHLSSLLIHPLPTFGLQYLARLLLDHDSNIVIALLQGLFAILR